MPPGEFSPSALLAIKLKAEQIWTDSRLAQEYKANSDSAKAVLENQTATFRELDNPEKDNQIVVNFINPCAIVVEDCVSNCDITEDELESGAKTYTLDLCKKTGFAVDAEKMRTNTYTVEEQSARGLASSLKARDDYWSQQVLVKLKAYAGVNVAPAPWTWAAGTTSVPAADYTVGMVANLINQSILNKMPGARRNHKGVFGQSSGREVPLVEVHFQGLDPGLVAVVGEAGRLELSVQPWNEKATVVDVVRAGHLVKDRLVYQVGHHADGVIRSGNRSCTSGPGPWSGRHVHAGVSLQLYQDLLAPILLQRF